MMDLQDFSETEDIALHYSLLFGGFHNGQIALIHSNSKELLIIILLLQYL